MQKFYKVSGMTFKGCSKTVSQKPEKVDGVNKALVDLAKSLLEILSDRPILHRHLKSALLLNPYATIIENMIRLLMADYMFSKMSLKFRN